MSKTSQKIWRAVIYIRISKENGEDTLGNQLKTVAEHLELLGNINVCAVKIDDGHSGLHTNRPAFQEMLNAIRHGEIDCVAVRDLSRLSRNYIDAGRYIQEIFPAQGVRFISVFEGFDFVKTPQYNVMMMVGFRNLVNEEYSRNLSQSVKSALSQGYTDGKYLGAFSVYGYQRSSGSRHHLEPDPIAAKVVQDIFQWKLEGMSSADIAEHLNQESIPSPAEYKKSTNFHTSFQKSQQAKWSSVAVGRILANRIYTGCLEQGKSMYPYFKANDRITKPTVEWTRIENTHEAIIPAVQYEAVARLLLMDTRKAPGEKLVPALAGFIRCKSCGQNMILKQHTSKGKTRRYYVCCGKNPENRRCPAHRISKEDLEAKVFRQIRAHMDDVRKIDEILSSLDISHISDIKRQMVAKELGKLRDDLELNRKCFRGLFDEFALRIYDDPDLCQMRLHYKDKCDILKAQIREIEGTSLDSHGTEAMLGWIELYKQFFSFEEVTRPMLAYLVRRIAVDGSKKVCLEFLYKREFEVLGRAVAMNW
jgi:DNA invertase Pin-like site-specific DNA recombinase/ssDNA-binding Zn-finger/Zn-ribbon topoisomerase 1